MAAAAGDQDERRQLDALLDETHPEEQQPGRAQQVGLQHGRAEHSQKAADDERLDHQFGRDVLVPPALEQPGRRVDPPRFSGRGPLRMLMDELTEHTVDKPAGAAGTMAAAGLRDGQIHCGVVGNVEEKNLRCRDVQERGERTGIFGKWLVECFGERRLDLAAATKCDTDDGAYKRAVALIELQKMRIAALLVEDGIERHVVLDYLTQHRRRGQADGETG